MTAALEAHPIANAFPMIEGKERELFAADIAANGLLEDIILFEGMILDGRNRHRECLAHGVPPRFRDYVGDDPVGFVISLNMRRRHLTTSQRAMAAVTIANLGRGRPKANNPQHCGISTRTAAAMLHVGTRSVETARQVADRGAPEVVEAVRNGRIDVTNAAAIATLDRQEQAALSRQDEAAILKRASEIRARQNIERRDARISKLEHIQSGTQPLPSGRLFSILLADCAWRFLSGDSDRSIENHYPTMTIAELCAMRVIDIAAPNAMLAFWATNPHLRLAFDVIEAWGFEYKSCFTWPKDKMGLGYWNRSQHETLLICTRGDFPAPLPQHRISSVIAAPRGRHSEKPACVAEWIERAWPTLSKIELFCRDPRPGWAVWGNQAQVKEAAAV